MHAKANQIVYLNNTAVSLTAVLIVSAIVFSGRCDFIATTGKIRRWSDCLVLFFLVVATKLQRPEKPDDGQTILFCFFPVGVILSQRPEKSDDGQTVLSCFFPVVATKSQ